MHIKDIAQHIHNIAKENKIRMNGIHAGAKIARKLELRGSYAYNLHKQSNLMNKIYNA